MDKTLNLGYVLKADGREYTIAYQVPSFVVFSSYAIIPQTGAVFFSARGQRRERVPDMSL